LKGKNKFIYLLPLEGGGLRWGCLDKFYHQSIIN